MVFSQIGSAVEGIYSFYDSGTGQTYVGRSNDIRRRILEHIRSPRRTVDLSKGFKILELRGLSLENLRIAEQLAIRDCGGVGRLSNKINSLNEARRRQVQELFDTLGDFLGDF